MPFASISIRTDRFGRLRKRSRSRSPPARRSTDDRRRRSRSRERHRRSRSRSTERISSSDKKQTENDKKTTTAPASSTTFDRETSVLRQVATLSGVFDPATFDKDEEQKKLEDEMAQRRQRIEKWRAEKNFSTSVIGLKLSTTTSSTKLWSGGTTSNKDAPPPPMTKSKRWADDDDDDDDEAASAWPSLKKTAVAKKKLAKPLITTTTSQATTVNGEAAAVAPADNDPDADPLEAFMQGVQYEVKQLQQRQVQVKKSNSSANILIQQRSVIQPQQPDPASTNNSSTSSTARGSKKGEFVAFEPEGALNQLMSSVKDDDTDPTAAAGGSTARDIADIERLAGGLQQSALSKQQKLSKAFNHQHGEYAPFEKDFHREVPEMAQMSDEQVNILRDRDGMQVRGKNCPKPILNWSQTGVSAKTIATLRTRGYETPTPIQAQAIPCIMSGRDVIGIAKTGSGKTLAFVLPFLRHCMAQSPLDGDDGPIGLVMAPTRELAVQIARECKKFCKPLGLEVACIYGGLGTSEQIAMLKRGVHLIVCTPGRMIEILMANNGRVTNLRRVTYLVLDEADRMFDMGFEPQVMLIIDNTRPDRQTVLFSATFPRQMEALAKRILDPRPIQIQIGGRSVVASDIEQHAVLIDEERKFLKLLELVGQYTESGAGVVLVFVDRQEKADMLLKQLMQASYTAMALHGGVDQFDRDSIINDFKNGNIQVLVATSIAARGLDVKNLILVVNYDCPNHYEDYVHRCGRTGRAGNKGFAYTFITPMQEKFTPDLVQGFERAGQDVPYDLKVMYETYRAMLSAEGKQVKGGSGFGGRGFKFDDMEQAVAKEARKVQQSLTTGAGEDDDFATAEGGRLENKIEGLFKSTKRVREGRPLGPFGAGGQYADPMPPPPAAVVNAVKNSVDIGQKLLEAQKRATQIRQDKMSAEAEKFSVEDMLRAADSTVKLIEGTTKSARGVAEQMASKIHAKLNYVRDEKPKTAEGAMSEAAEEAPAQTFEEELDINDFPQQVRFRLTSKEILAGVCEYADAYVSVRGQYVPPAGHKQSKLAGTYDADRRLHLMIEAVTEIGVSKAKADIIRIVKEELLKMQHAPVAKTTRYKVV